MRQPVHTLCTAPRVRPAGTFSRDLRLSPERCREAPPEASGPLLYSPPPGPSGALSSPSLHRPLRRRRRSPRARVRRRSRTPWPASSRAAARGPATPPGTSGSSRCAPARSRPGRSSSRRPTRSAPWVAVASRASCRPAPPPCSGPGVTVELVGPEPTAGGPPPRRTPAGPLPAGADRRRRRRVQPAPHVRPVRDRRRQPARPRRRARRRRAARPGLQPALPLRPARPRQDAPAALDRQLRERPRRRADGPLHDGRGLHQRLRRRAARRRRSRPSRPPTATSTSCSSTTSSSSQSKAKTEEEFFHTFNALYGAGAQLVLTSDRLPRDMDALEDRLRERFESGLVTDVRPPDSARA